MKSVRYAISPNGLSLSKAGIISISEIDFVFSVDIMTKQVRVKDDTHVSKVVESLRTHRLTVRYLSRPIQAQRNRS